MPVLAGGNGQEKKVNFVSMNRHYTLDPVVGGYRPVKFVFPYNQRRDIFYYV